MANYAERGPGLLRRLRGGAGQMFQSNMARRIASAFLMMPIALLGVWSGGPAFGALVGAMAVILLFEWTRMVEGAAFSPRFFLLAPSAAAACLLASTGRHEMSAIAAFVGVAAASLAAAGASPSRGESAGRRIAWMALAGPYLIAPAWALIWLRGHEPLGVALTLSLFFVVWATDSGAYLAGRGMGGPRLSPSVSPKKTWSGVVGGLVAAIATAIACDIVFFGASRPAIFGVCGAFLSMATQLGDVTESTIKRRFGVKDTGGLIPGHGGALDRLDGMIFAALTAAAALLITDLTQILEARSAG
ncbi:MAG: phosphatidate cytidylyltransferase [Pseudomonadota bacterium]